MNVNKKFFANVRNFIAKGKLLEALQQLRVVFESSTMLDEIIQQSARFNDIKKQIRLGTISNEDSNLTQNQIRQGLLAVLRELEEQSNIPHIQKEMEKTINIIDKEKGNTNISGDNSNHQINNITQNADKIYNIDKMNNANFS